MRIPGFDLDRVISELSGTYNSLRDVLPDGMIEEDLTLEEHMAIDAVIFQCVSCGWWFDVEEGMQGLGIIVLLERKGLIDRFFNWLFNEKGKPS